MVTLSFNMGCVGRGVPDAPPDSLQAAISALSGGASLAVVRDGEITHRVTGSGLRPLFALCNDCPETLQDAAVADKVVGRAAASLLITRGAAAVYGAVMSVPARDWLLDYGIAAEYGVLTPRIENRDGTGLCPMEQLTADCETPAEAAQRIQAKLTIL